MKETNKFERMGITEEDANRIALELLEQVHETKVRGISLLNRCREIIRMGISSYEESIESVSFLEACRVSLEERSCRRERTVSEIRQICNRFMRNEPKLRSMKLRSIRAEDCLNLLKKNAASAHQYVKMRAVLHSIFTCGKKHGWCSKNPVESLLRPVVHEAEIVPLRWDDIKSLLHTAKKEEHKSCAAAVGIMLWAGVRPAELSRISWEDIDWQENVINLRAHHTKTGGCRHVTIHPVLKGWLNALKHKTGSICPPNWINRWRKLRQAAGINRWQQDVLRHTFASYHLKYWHNISQLQEEMGHRSARLLRTRYLSMKGITRHHAHLFWSPGKLG